MATREIDDAELESIMVSRREKLRLDRDAKQQELDDIDKNIRRIEGYLNPAGATVSKPRAAPGPRTPRGKLPALQQEIIEIIKRYPDGAKAENINAELDARDEKTKRQIAAALYRMNKSEVLKQAGARQPYTLGPNAPQSANAPTHSVR